LPINVPPFVQYQSPMFPLRGLWNRAPVEGDQFVNVEIDWLLSPPGAAVQFSLSGNSPVALSQIVALSVDNGRCGSDVDFIFPDSGFVLTVPAHAQGLYPVFTNALMFYASGPAASLGDTTIFQILNSLPPPIQVAQSGSQNHAAAFGFGPANGTTPIAPAPTSGTLNVLNLTATDMGPGSGTFFIEDGAGRILFAMALLFPAAGRTLVWPVAGLDVRFTGGLFAVVTGSDITTGALVVNAYFTTP
jgi:hypothetical protein